MSARDKTRIEELLRRAEIGIQQPRADVRFANVFVADGSATL